MQNLFIATLLLFCMLVSVHAQSSPPEYGDISELQNLHKVYIYTDDLEARDRIVKEVKKYEGLEVVGRLDDSDFVLMFNGGRVSTGKHSSVYVDPNTGYGSGSSRETYAELGGMKAVMPGSQPNTLRILWHTDKSTKFRFGKDPEVKCIQEFIKTLKKLRGEK